MHDNTPVLVGAGQFTGREEDPLKALSPMGIAAEAARAALADTGLDSQSLAQQIDTLAVIRIFPDSFNRPRMPNPFGRAENPPRAVARRINANPVRAIYGHVGGNTPQTMINEMAHRIAEGEVGVALITGSEAIKTAQRALRAGITLDWQEEDEGSLEDRGIGPALASAHEFAHGIGIPVNTYPLFENAIRGRLGHSVAQHLLAMGELFAPFTDVAATNPFALYGTRRSPQELARVSAENRFIGFPYPKWMNAMDGVDQGAAVVMTSVGQAKRLGIDPARWVFLHGCAEASEKLLVTERVNYFSSPAMEINSAKALAMAGKEMSDIDLIDIYSCFPSAVEVACAALGIQTNDPRGLTLTGGLPFFGGPGNNYSMHAIATLVSRLRNRRSTFGMITANGGYLSKHATGIYSAIPVEGEWRREAPATYQGQIDAMLSPRFTETPEGDARVETYTVIHERGVPVRGIVIGRLVADNTRFIANTLSDAETLGRMMVEEMLDRPGSVTTGDGAEGTNLFSF